MTDNTDLRLADFRPRSSLRVPVHSVSRPSFPVIDFHHHVGPFWGQELANLPVAEIVAMFDDAGVESIVSLEPSFGDDLSRVIDRWATYQDRVVVFAGPNYEAWATDPAFGETEARRLEDSARRGAHGLKIWKTLGLRARDPDGRLVPVDDERLDPLWATAAKLDFPVVIHIADPAAFFEPLDPRNERWEELQAHPDWHFWPTRAAGDHDAAGFPNFYELIAQFDRLLGRHPSTTFIGAHVGCAAEDLGLVSRLLDAHPNLYVDIAERLGELGRQPYTTRSFFLRHADRILFGTDGAGSSAVYGLYYRFLETFDESFDYGIESVPRQGRWQIYGVGLPQDVLRKVYRDNALRTLRRAGAPETLSLRSRLLDRSV